MVDWLVGRVHRPRGCPTCRRTSPPTAPRRSTGVRPGPPGRQDRPAVLPLRRAAAAGRGRLAEPPFELTERDGRWYGRGAADCKGSIASCLTALRALGDDLPVTVKVIGEGSEEQGTGGLEGFVPRHPELLRADAILVCDSGNFAVGLPTLTTSLRGVADLVVKVETSRTVLHSGMFGGAAPDALAALIAMLRSLRDERRQHDDRRPGRRPAPGTASSTRTSGSARTPRCSTASS